MVELLELYNYAEQQEIDVDWFSMESGASLSLPLPNGKYAIAIDPYKLGSIADEKEKLGHELGHCGTCSFYNRWATCDIRKKHENRADKWAVQKLISAEDLDAAVAEGCAEMWELAERFDVTHEFMKKVVCWYTHGNLATELYF